MDFIGICLARAERLMLWGAVIAAVAIMALTSADAILRYTINAPVVGAFEITEKYLMPAAIFLGMTWAYRGGAFIRVTFLVDLFSGPVRLAFDYLAWAISLISCGMFIYATGLQAVRAMSDTTMLATINLPAGPAYSLVPVGFFAICLMMLADLPRVGKGDALLFAQDAPAL